MQVSIATDLLVALDLVVMQQMADGHFIITGAIPDWLRQLDPGIDNQQELNPGEKFLFLEPFLIEAENNWWQQQGKVGKSGWWIETDASGKEYQLEAAAVRLQAEKILLIELLSSEYKQTQIVLQTARENLLSYQRLIQEIQKKEILIHCIVHDLAGQLTVIDYCFQLLELQDLTTKGKEYVKIGKQQSLKQQKLIQEILDAFSAEVESLEAFIVEPQSAPDVLACTQEVVNTLLPTFLQNHKDLLIYPNVDPLRDWQVVGEKSRLERVLLNLIENAGRYSPPKTAVTIELKPEGDFVFVSVEDQGPGVSPELAETLFQKFSQGKDQPGKSGLGLYFCRVTVEHWGGKIGYSDRAEGGAKFWFCLPRLSDSK